MTVKTAAPSSPKVKKFSRLNVKQVEEISAYWKTGTVTLEGLATKYKVDVRTIQRAINKTGAIKGEKEAETKRIAEETVEKAVIADAALYLKRVKETKEDHYKMSAALGKLIFSKVIQTETAGIKQGTIAGDIKTLQLAAMALKTIREERYATLGINADDAGEDKPLPDLTVQELTVEDIEKMSKDNFVTDDDDIDFEIDSLGDDSLVEKEEYDDKVITE